jgi:hypothetical protein
MDDTGMSTVEHGGMEVTSVGVSAADVAANFDAVTDEAPAETTEKAEKETKGKGGKAAVSDAARTLGQRGGKAAAERRAEAKDAKPAPGAEEKAQEAPQARGSDTPAEDEDEDDAPLSDRARKRVEQATRAAAEAKRTLEAEKRERERERRQYEADLAALRAQQRTAPERAEARDGQRQTSEDRDPLAMPREEDYESYQEYLDARDEVNRRRWDHEQERKAHAEKQVREYRDHVDSFLAAAREDRDTAQAIIPELRTAPYFMRADDDITLDSIIVGEATFLKAKGLAVLKHLSDHPEALQELRDLERFGAACQPHIRAEMKFIAKTLDSQADATAGEPPARGERPSKVAPSKAPPPVRPVTGAPHIAGERPPREDEDFDTWLDSKPRR